MYILWLYGMNLSDRKVFVSKFCASVYNASANYKQGRSDRLTE